MLIMPAFRCMPWVDEGDPTPPEPEPDPVVNFLSGELVIFTGGTADPDAGSAVDITRSYTPHAQAAEIVCIALGKTEYKDGISDLALTYRGVTPAQQTIWTATTSNRNFARAARWRTGLAGDLRVIAQPQDNSLWSSLSVYVYSLDNAATFGQTLLRVDDGSSANGTGSLSLTSGQADTLLLYGAAVDYSPGAGTFTPTGYTLLSNLNWGNNSRYVYGHFGVQAWPTAGPQSWQTDWTGGSRRYAIAAVEMRGA